MDKKTEQLRMSPSPLRRPKSWRRKWKRSDPARRLAAAASLGDTFAPRRSSQWVLLGALAVSLVLHVAGVTMVSLKAPASTTDELAAQENTYLQKVAQKERGRQVAREMSGKITMPPPPPDPEGVVQNALTESLTSDVEKITTGLLDVKLQQDLTKFVRSSLKEDLDAASKNIAQGKLSDGEIQQLHRKFQDKAQDLTVAWRQDYLIKHQEERAAVSTTEWYERDVGKTFVNNIFYEIFRREHVYAWQIFTRHMGAGHGPDFFIYASQNFGNRLSLFGSAVNGMRFYNDKPDASWPGPNKEQADWLGKRLGELLDGTQAQYAHNYAAGSSLEQLFAFNALAYCPHRQQEVADLKDKVKAAREKALAACQAYKDKADAGTPADQLKGLQQAAFDSIKAVAAAAGAVQSLHLPKDFDYRGLDRAIKTEVLTGPVRDKAHKEWSDKLLAGLEPLIRDFAKGQFKKGIIVHTGGVDQAMKEFPTTVIPLLTRDIERIIPEKRFADIVFQPYMHTSKVTTNAGPPSAEEIEQEKDMIAKACADPQGKAYCDKLRATYQAQLDKAVAELSEEVLTRTLTGGLLFKQMDLFVEGVDYADKVQEKLNARAMALKGRGQDLAKLTADGVPDTSAPLVALMLGASKGHGANLEPVATAGVPAMMAEQLPVEKVLIYGSPKLPRPAAKVGFEEQAAAKPTFANSPRFEAVPFLPKFPRLDGDLSDWGKIRPLILKGPAGQAVLVYAAWNYQGFFFGYTVAEEAERFYWPSQWRQAFNHNTGGVWYLKDTSVDWAFRGDYFRLMFDTLDARNDNRGEPHMQEFVIFPLGTESDPTVPGIEREIKSQRDAEKKEYRGVKASCRSFPPQPPADNGPDGSGPFRVTRARGDGYTSEVFLPRSLLRVPVFAPGWYIGFDCAVAMGVQPGNQQFKGQVWATGNADNPDHWGDLLLLGTDPVITVQEASPGYPVVSTMIPGHSYLVTVIDPDRNVYPSAIDTVIVSAEVQGTVTGVAVQGEPSPVLRTGDVEVFVLRETKENSGVFRGFINTQPGAGRQVQGVLEIMPMQEVRLGYVDFANSKGQRNVINEMRLPVVAPMLQVAAQK